jgi:hypothetical protein
VVAVTVEHSDAGGGEMVGETDDGRGVVSSGRAEGEEVMAASEEVEDVDKTTTGLGVERLRDESTDDDVETSLEVKTTTLGDATSVGSVGQMVNVRRRSVLVMGVTPGAHAFVTNGVVLADEVNGEEDDVSVGRAEQDMRFTPSCRAMVTATVPEEHPVATDEVEVEVGVGVEVAVIVGRREQ